MIGTPLQLALLSKPLIFNRSYISQINKAETSDGVFDGTFRTPQLAFRKDRQSNAGNVALGRTMAATALYVRCSSTVVSSLGMSSITS